MNEILAKVLDNLAADAREAEKQRAADLADIEGCILKTGCYSMSLNSVNKYWRNAEELTRWMLEFKAHYRKCNLGEPGVEFYI